MASSMTQSTSADRRAGDQLGFLVFFLACYGVSVAGSLMTSASIRDWYPLLDKPSWTPPNWLFAPVWLTLYGMMALAGYLVWRRREEKPVTVPLTLFGIQLLLNLAWSGLFFTLRSPLLGLIDISLLWLAIVATIWAFARVRPLAAWLLVPYLLWVSYALALNASIWSRN